MEEIMQRLDRLEAMVKKQNKRFAWEEKTTESGIQIAGGPTTVTRTGTVVAAAPFQVGPTQMTIVLVLQEDLTNKICIVPAEGARPVTD